MKLNLSEEDEEIMYVYANFGLAVYAAQCLEHELVNDFLYLELIPNQKALRIQKSDWERVFDAFTSEHFKKTLGMLIKHLAELTNVDAELQEKLTKVLETRNWLVHHYFKERAVKFISSSGRKEMIIELQGITNEIHDLDGLLVDTFRPVKAKYGMTDEVIEKYYQEMINQEC